MHAIINYHLSSRSDVADRQQHDTLDTAHWPYNGRVGVRLRPAWAPRREVRSARFYTHMCRNVELPESTTVCTVGCT